jgi:hypothetical protein
VARPAGRAADRAGGRAGRAEVRFALRVRAPAGDGRGGMRAGYATVTLNSGTTRAPAASGLGPIPRRVGGADTCVEKPNDRSYV